MKLVVGLGNPGRRYEGTRHNIGYACWPSWPASSARRRRRTKFHGEVVEADLSGQKALLLSPTTFMNLSGTSVQEAKSFYKIAERGPAGHLRRPELAGGQAAVSGARLVGRSERAGGHYSAVGDGGVSRLRIGIGTAPEGWDWADYVLSKFTPEELPDDRSRPSGWRPTPWPSGPARASSSA